MSVSRRSVLSTAVWSVPAVTLATASPAFASSTPQEPVKPALVKVWKEPGNGQHPPKGYYVAFMEEDYNNVASVFIVLDGVDVSASRDAGGINAIRNVLAFGVFEKNNSRTPGGLKVVMLDGTSHVYSSAEVQFLPWSAS